MIDPIKMRRAMIRQAADLRGIPLSRIGADLGVTRQHVYHVLAGRRRNAQIEKRLAALVGIPAKELFPPRARNTTKE